MTKYKIISDGYITAIGSGSAGDEISQEEYDAILSAIQNKPPRSGDMDYRLRADLTWEPTEVPPPPPYDADIDEFEAYDIIFGGAE